MARISTYALDSDVTANDKVIGTDSAGTITRNYKISDITDFLNRSGSIDIAGSRFKYVRPGSNQTLGFLKFAVDQGNTPSFSSINNLQLHKQDLSEVELLDFYEAIEGSLVLIQKADDASKFGVFEWSSSTRNSSDTNLYDISVVFKGGNGTLENEKDYLISLLLFRFDDYKDKNKVINQATPSTTWTMNHGLNKKPSVTVVDSSGEKVIGLVDYVDLNNVTITFVNAASGDAYFN